MSSRFSRLVGKRRYKRMFVIVAEGTVTESEYFRLLNDGAIVHIKCIRNRGNLPPNEALRRVRESVSEESLQRMDEAWVVVDRDSWPEEHLAELHRWSRTKGNFGFALSNPKFEYWLLLHFEDANQVVTSQECDKHLAKHLPHYDKHISEHQFPVERIQLAVERAISRDNPRCTDWPRKPGSTVYRLVEKILAQV